MAKNLLIVESPAKAKTINKYLGKDFHVLASYGHVRDLKPKEGAVDPDHGFAMAYEVIERNEKHVDAIAKAAKLADDIYLATDLDREGEAISWHISEILKERGLTEGKHLHRVVFSEITPKAIKAAVAQPRQLSHDMVDAQQARRALDYLVGFNLSPVLWRKVQRGLSAGRVQSPALRMIAEREEEIEAFVAREYWSVEAALRHPDGDFTARLTKLNGKKFEQFDLTNEHDAMAARAALKEAAHGRLTVSDVGSKERKRRPAPPFTTSTLQQEAARKLGFSTSRTMKIAQGLYEGVSLGSEGNVGLITYMRTDSVALSEDAVTEMRQLIARDFGAKALPDHPQVYKAKSKNAQEAHEAIRPTSAMLTPREVSGFLNEEQRKLYELIWKRTVACQMIHATLNTVSVEFALPHVAGATPRSAPAAPRWSIRASWLSTRKAATRRAPMTTTKVVACPSWTWASRWPLHDIEADQHFTEPPPRYSEASLVKTLEEHGIGRPSTYASIIQVLLNREYVLLDSRRFKPTDVGRAVEQVPHRAFRPLRRLRLHRQARRRARRGQPWRRSLGAPDGALLAAVQAAGGREDRIGRSQRSHRRARTGHRSEDRQAGVGAPGSLWRVRADRRQGRRTRSCSSLRCVPARACTPSRWRMRWSCSSCRASWARPRTAMRSASASVASVRS